ncbi:MAG: DUF86 domain-containing protein [Candidatus Sumerlaeia bacterium]|nr:DUF86 domain-containing protein [Candidatus Sumerlaeia bacterium]
MRSDELYLRDILRAADDLTTLIQGLTVVEFADRMLERRAALQALAEIGEACARISTELKARHPEVAWKMAVAVRNFAVHAYFGVEWDIIHATITGDIPPFRLQIAEIVEQEFPSNLSAGS